MVIPGGMFFLWARYPCILWGHKQKGFHISRRRGRSEGGEARGSEGVGQRGQGERGTTATTSPAWRSDSPPPTPPPKTPSPPSFSLSLPLSLPLRLSFSLSRCLFHRACFFIRTGPGRTTGGTQRLITNGGGGARLCVFGAILQFVGPLGLSPRPPCLSTRPTERGRISEARIRSFRSGPRQMSLLKVHAS